jgi:hypothetical protein
MPLLCRILSAVITTYLLNHGSYHILYRMPPLVPPLVKLHQWLISDWNNGAYPASKDFHYESSLKHHNESISPFHTKALARHTATSYQHRQLMIYTPLVTWLIQSAPEQKKKIYNCRLTFTVYPPQVTKIKCTLGQILNIFALTQVHMLAYPGSAQTSSTYAQSPNSRPMGSVLVCP